MSNALHGIIILTVVFGYVAALTVVLVKVTDAKLANQKEGN